MTRALICLIAAIWLLAASGAPARAEPITIALFSTIGVTLAAGSVAASVATFALTVGLSVGLSYLQGALRGGKAAEPDMPTGGSTGKLAAGGVVPRSTGVGKFMTGGSLVYANTFGQDGKTPNAYLTQVIALSDLPGILLRQVWVNGAPCDIDVNAPQDEHGVPFPQFTFLGKTYLWLRFYDGTQTTADAKLVALFGGDDDRPYTANRVGFGVAYVVITALVKEEVWSGFPQFKFVGDGIPLYDRRFDSTAGGSGPQRLGDPDTWAFTETPAVIRENILRGFRYDGQWQWGGQSITEAQLPPASWMAAANECDAPIALVGGGTEPQFRAGGEIVFSAMPADVLDELNKADNGKLAEIGGIYKTRSGAAGAAVFHFTDANILSDKAQTFEPFAPLASQINHVTARYLSPAEGWNLKDAPPLVDEELEDLDGRRVSAPAEYGFVSSGTQVQRLMRAERDTARAWRRHALPLPPEAFVLEPLDVVSWTSARNGYETKTFEVVSGEDFPSLCVGVALKELDPAAYDWTPGVHQKPVIDGTITVIRPAPQPIVAWFAEGYTLTVGDRRRAAILLGWDPDTDDVGGIRFEVRLKASQELQLTGEEGRPVFERGSLIVSQNLLPATVYQARGQYRPSSPRDVLWSNWLDVTTPDVTLSSIEIAAEMRASIAATAQRLDEMEDFVGRQIGRLGSRTYDYVLRASANVGTMYGRVSTVEQVTIGPDSVLSVLGARVEAGLGDNSGTLASLEQVYEAFAGPGGAYATDRTHIVAAITGSSATIDGEATAVAALDGRVAALWTFKVDVNGNFAKLTLGADGSESNIALLADNVLFRSPGYPDLAFKFGNIAGGPGFGLQGGKWFVDGETYITQTAHLADAVITSAKIGNGEITNAKIGNAAITSAKIGTAEVTDLKIANASVGVGDGASVAANVSGDGVNWQDRATIVLTFTNTVNGSIIPILLGGRIALHAAGTSAFQYRILVNGVEIFYNFWVPPGAGDLPNQPLPAATHLTGTGGTVTATIVLQQLCVTGYFIVAGSNIETAGLKR